MECIHDTVPIPSIKHAILRDFLFNLEAEKQTCFSLSDKGSCEGLVCADPPSITIESMIQWVFSGFKCAILNVIFPQKHQHLKTNCCKDFIIILDFYATIFGIAKLRAVNDKVKTIYNKNNVQ